MKFVFLIALSMSVFAISDKWNSYNNPFRLNPNFEDVFENLPLSGDISQSGLGWPGYYWANKLGGIAQRWAAKKPKHFKYKSPALYNLRSMSIEQKITLSPAEKFDILMGEYSYPTVEKVWGQTKKTAKSWHGICHGVSPAGLHHIEPKAKTLVNKDGIEVPFFSSDIKALLGYYYAKISRTNVTQVGRRCFVKKMAASFSKACQDAHPATFHIIAANTLGVTKDGFIADIDRLKEVWNHVAVKFSSEILGRSAATESSTPGAVERVMIMTYVHYTGGVDPSSHAILGTENEKWDVRAYKYTLDIDGAGRIIGGEWNSKQRPDFIWIKDKARFSHNYYGKIQKLL